MHYEGNIIRPPSEANSIILQVTVGCSHNKCTFCVTYNDKPRFALKPREVVEADIEKASRIYPTVKRLFVGDGDALAMPMAEWRWMLPMIREKLPLVERVGCYATGKAVRGKTDGELEWLRKKRLKIIYLGVESGDDETLFYIKKDSGRDELIEAGKRIKAAGMKLSVTVLLGIAPKGRAQEHARLTGELLSEMDPNYVGALSVMLCPGTEMYDAAQRGEHPIVDAHGYLEELRTMLEHTTMTRGLFMANHASNHLPIQVRMPKQKDKALALIDEALDGKVSLKAEEYRAL